ncbi:MAG: RNA polymerase sigma-70 factor (ECF subfamily) [Planctomycetota bacterium]|jgi:RNA polymerase sigma-70 factor (ECF subfamily)
MHAVDDLRKNPIPLKGPGDPAYESSVETQVIALMSATKAGDDSAFDSLTELLRGRAFSVARSLVGSREDALDLTQEAFMKTYRARDTYRDGEPFLPWFHRILRNTCFSHLRKHRRLVKHSLTTKDEDSGDWDIAGDEPGPSHGLEQDEAAQAFWVAFRTLAARDREILALRHFEELAYRDIARSLDIPEGTVMSRLFHARKRLRQALQPFLGGALQDYAFSAVCASQSATEKDNSNKGPSANKGHAATMRNEG